MVYIIVILNSVFLICNLQITKSGQNVFCPGWIFPLWKNPDNPEINPLFFHLERES